MPSVAVDLVAYLAAASPGKQRKEAIVPIKNAQAGADLKPVIMVIEPEVLVRMTIAEFLRDCGFKVVEGIVAEDVRSVIDAGTRLDIVFSEVRLAGKIDGFALATQLRNTHPGIDVILTSGVTGAAEKSTQLCAEGPLKKPYKAADVAAHINLLLERRRSAPNKP
jgi:DNA-binding NtrC family response regulator